MFENIEIDLSLLGQVFISEITMAIKSDAQYTNIVAIMRKKDTA